VPAENTTGEQNENVTPPPFNEQKDFVRLKGTIKATLEKEFERKLQATVEAERKRVTKELEMQYTASTPGINKKAIAGFVSANISFKFIDKNGNSPRKIGAADLIGQACEPGSPERFKTQIDLNAFFFTNCVALSPATGYQIVDQEIDLAIKPTVLFFLNKTKPQNIAKIEVSVEMDGASTISNKCFIGFDIVPEGSDTPIYSGSFSTTNRRPLRHTFSKKIKKTVAWPGNILVIKRHPKADCRPKGGEQRMALSQDMISYGGVLAPLNRIPLESTLAKAVLVLNTMVGEGRVNASNSTSKLYAIANTPSSRELLIEMVSQTLQQLHGNISGLTIGVRNAEGALVFKDLSSSFKDLNKNRLVKTAKKLAENIVDRVQFVESNFVWFTMENAVKRYEKKHGKHKYKVYIGQSGLPYNKDYCDDRDRNRALKKAGATTFIYDFATDENIRNPDLTKIDMSLVALPAVLCGNNNPRHVVFFPQTVKSGRNKTVSAVFTKAFKDLN
jgi:hypothetical protein